MTEDEKVECHHWLTGHEFEKTPGDVEGQGSLACCSPWKRKELDRTEQQQNNSNNFKCFLFAQTFPRHQNFLTSF